MRKYSANISDVSCNHHSYTSQGQRGSYLWDLGWSSPTSGWLQHRPPQQLVSFWLPELINHALTGLYSQPEVGWAWASDRL